MDVAEKCYKRNSYKIKEKKRSMKDSATFWKKVFNEIDQQTDIAPHRRPEILEQLIDAEVLPTVLEILNLRTRKEPEKQIVRISDESKENVKTEPVIQRVSQFQERRPPSLQNFHQEKQSGENMYQKFLKNPKKARRWRPARYKHKEGQVNIAEEVEELTQKIALEFVEWMDGVGGTHKGLNNDEVKALFEIGFDDHCANSLTVNVKELNAVPLYIAFSQHVPEASYHSRLYNQLYRDVEQVRNREENYAFGTMLPVDMRSYMESNVSLSKWLENKRIPQRLVDMDVVWEGIEKFRSTIGFCKYLMNYPGMKRPKYLEKILKNLKGSEEELISIKTPSMHRQSLLHRLTDDSYDESADDNFDETNVGKSKITINK